MTVSRNKIAIELLRIAAVAVVVVGVMLVAQAGTGGSTDNTLSFAGTLLDAQGKPAGAETELQFVFKKAGTAVCTVDAAVDPDDQTGWFVAQLHVDQGTGIACGPTLFDGAPVTIDVLVDEHEVVTGQPVGAVPYAKYADQVGTPDCPVGYQLDAQVAAGGGGPGGGSPSVAAPACVKGHDQVVKVGTGPSAFWIDRYEASLWSDPAGTLGTGGEGTHPYGVATDDLPESFPDNGQWRGRTPLVYAVSRSGVRPSANLTWFQASEACAASGKRLPTSAEWLRAARGTVDGPGCLTDTGDSVSRPTGYGWTAECVSDWGAEDMIGNLWEWVADWQWSLNDAQSFGSGTSAAPWPSDYGGDRTFWITSTALVCDPANPSCDVEDLSFRAGLPGALVRGGCMNDGDGAGLFAMDSMGSPALYFATVGLRCVIPQ